MEDDLAKQWEGLSLTEKETEEVILNINSSEATEQYGKFCLLGMIIAEKPVNREAFKSTMAKIWRCESWFKFSEVGTNKFLVEFNKEEDLQKVIKGRPWSFDRWLLCLQVFEGNRFINELLFNKEEFWVHAYNMPFSSMTYEVGVQIGGCIGRVITIQVDDRGIGWGKFLRIRVEVNISEALLRGVFLSFAGKKTWVPLKYERLPTFCFKCGVIKHAKSGCSVSSLGDSKLQYGAWLRAPATKDSEDLHKTYGNVDTQHYAEGNEKATEKLLSPRLATETLQKPIKVQELEKIKTRASWKRKARNKRFESLVAGLEENKAKSPFGNKRVITRLIAEGAVHALKKAKHGASPVNYPGRIDMVEVVDQPHHLP
ncbi:uncharacterized protein LOC121235381 [Juglans microcarpa x Juglans regia]|uniref:uncharacterized protein LOC121235381 n=1 Tax=Juglans microcarpa x Juglans regia TaxID=2249226 RepID=UPI001B7F2125|nr:uncharacterized protein LOC121235381 [Juglans microcarpa x Juglans regia]